MNLTFFRETILARPSLFDLSNTGSASQAPTQPLPCARLLSDEAPPTHPAERSGQPTYSISEIATFQPIYYPETACPLRAIPGQPVLYRKRPSANFGLSIATLSGARGPASLVNGYLQPHPRQGAMENG